MEPPLVAYERRGVLVARALKVALRKRLLGGGHVPLQLAHPLERAGPLRVVRVEAQCLAEVLARLLERAADEHV